MRVISFKVLRAFWEAGQADAEKPLRRWHALARKHRWAGLADVRKVFAHADEARVGGERLLVFNIAGNKYRLVARVRYDWGLLNIRAVMTHAEYDKGAWKR